MRPKPAHLGPTYGAPFADPNGLIHLTVGATVAWGRPSG